MKSISDLYGGLLEKLFLAACAVLFLMMLMICADVFLRNVPLVPSLRGLSWADEVSEYMLYLIAMLFVIFDVEAASFYPWAVQMHALRVFGLLEMSVFIVVLAIGYAYVWKKGGFVWR